MTPLRRAFLWVRPTGGRTMVYVLLIGGLAVVAVCMMSMVAAVHLRMQQIDQAERNLKTLDVLLGEETERAIQSADLVLRSLQDRIRSDGVVTSEDLLKTQNSPQTRAILQSRLAGIPQISALVIVDKNGDIIASSRAESASPFNIADRGHFKTLRTANPDAVTLSEPYRSHADQRWTSYLARRINDPMGGFLGLVVCAIDLAYFEDLYRSLDVGSGGAVSLWRTNGMLMARFPPLPEQTGHAIPIKSFSGILREDRSVTYHTPRSIDGGARIVATIKAREFPLVINVTETLEQVLADWRQMATMIALGCLSFIVAVVAVIVLLTRQVRAHDAIAKARAERGQAEAARDRAEEQLRQAQKLDALGQLTGGVAHDFNNLLTAVLGNLELLQRHCRHQEERMQRWVQNALEAAQRGAVLTQRLLAFSRRQPLNPTSTDVTRLIGSLSDLLEQTLGENIEMDTRLADGLWHVEVDPNQLDNAILNIAINARDAMEGRGRLTIEGRNCRLGADGEDGPAQVTGAFVLIVIADTGRGIPPDVLDHVFEPFFTTKPIGQGTGLGLSQVYGFVKQSGGHILIKSEVGVGTRVMIYLPLANEQIAPARIDQDDEPIALGRRIWRVLVVEDDAAVRDYALESLRDLGFETFAAGDASEALTILKGGARIDVLFTDVGLPGCDGYELAIQAQRIKPHLLVMFASGYTSESVLGAGRTDPAPVLLAKPYTRADLKTKLTEVLSADRPEIVRAITA